MVVISDKTFQNCELRARRLTCSKRRLVFWGKKGGL